MGNVHTCGPNTALVVSGGCRGGSNRKTTVIGGWAWAWWLVTDVQRLTLEIMTLEPECHAVETIQGVPITVTGVAQIKVMTNPDLLQAALEQFLGKDPSELKRTILGTLEGHLRSILGTMTVEEIYKDRDAFADRVKLDLNKLFSRFFFHQKFLNFFWEIKVVKNLFRFMKWLNQTLVGWVLKSSPSRSRMFLTMLSTCPHWVNLERPQ